MNKPSPTMPTLLAGWRQGRVARQPGLLSIEEPLPSESIRAHDQAGAKQASDNEGGAVKAPPVPGPKLPL